MNKNRKNIFDNRDFIDRIADVIKEKADLDDTTVVDEVVSALFSSCVIQNKYDKVSLLSKTNPVKSKEPYDKDVDEVIIDEDVPDVFNTLSLRKNYKNYVISFVRFLTDISELPKVLKDYLDSKRPCTKTKDGLKVKEPENYNSLESKNFETLKHDVLMAYNVLIAYLVRENTDDLGIVMHYTYNYDDLDVDEDFNLYLKVLYGNKGKQCYILNEKLADGRFVLVPNRPSEFYKKNNLVNNFTVSDLLFAFDSSKKNYSDKDYSVLEGYETNMKVRNVERVENALATTTNVSRCKSDIDLSEKLDNCRVYFCYDEEQKTYAIIDDGSDAVVSNNLSKCAISKVEEKKWLEWTIPAGQNETIKKKQLYVDSAAIYTEEFGYNIIWTSSLSTMVEYSKKLWFSYATYENKKKLVLITYFNMIPVFSSGSCYFDCTQSFKIRSVYGKSVLQPKDVFNKNRTSTLCGKEKFKLFSELPNQTIEYLFSCVLNHLLWYAHLGKGSNVLSVFDNDCTVLSAKMKYFKYFLPEDSCKITFVHVKDVCSKLQNIDADDMNNYIMKEYDYEDITAKMKELVDIYGYADDKDEFDDTIGAFSENYLSLEDLEKKEVIPMYDKEEKENV